MIELHNGILSKLRQPMNLNDPACREELKLLTVKVVLTDEGLNWLHEYYETCDIPLDSIGTSKEREFNLWNLIEIFGPIYLFRSHPFFEKIE